MSKEAIEIINQLKKRNFSPVYFLCGEEPYYIDLISNYIEQHLLSEDERSFNQTILYGRDTDISGVVAEAKRFPMMSDYTLVIVKEAQNIKKWDELLPYLEKQLISTVLVLCHKYGKPDGRTSFGAKIKKLSVYLESKKLYDNQVPDWISAFVKNKKYSIHPKASLLISEYLGNDLSKIANEINKLSINLKEGSEISEQHIQENIGISKEYNPFELQAALGSRDVLKSNKIIHYFAQNINDHPPQMIIPILYGYFVKIMMFQKVADNNKNPKNQRIDAAKALKVNPFFLKDYEVASRNYSPLKLVEIISILRKADLKSKGVDNINTDSSELMKETVYRILH